MISIEQSRNNFEIQMALKQLLFRKRKFVQIHVTALNKLALTIPNRWAVDVESLDILYIIRQFRTRSKKYMYQK